MPEGAAGVATGFRLLFGLVGAITTVAGLINQSTVVALNTAGVVGLAGLVIGGIAMGGDWKDPDPESVKFVLVVVGVVTLISGVVFLLGRGLDDSEQEFGVLTFMGMLVLAFYAGMAGIGWRMLVGPRAVDDLRKSQERQGTKPRPPAAAQGLGKEVACPQCGRHFATDRARDQHVAAKHEIQSYP
jgi:hypothetical protein